MSASDEQLAKWADSLLHVNHLNPLVQREIAAGHSERAAELSERARRRAWEMFNEMVDAGGKTPEGYVDGHSDSN